MLSLSERYENIHQQIISVDDFQDVELERSRNLFDAVNNRIRPRSFEVWTCIAGLPVPTYLASNFQKIVSKIASILPLHVRFYKVLPENYHWEIFVIQRPPEILEKEKLLFTAKILESVADHYNNTLTIEYRGFLITGEGTIIARGYGDLDSLRGQMHDAIPYASQKQSNLGHISLGRILDPVGSKVFGQLKQLIYESESEIYGNLPVKEIKYIHETQWYMENREIISVIPLAQNN